jgi:hypothetical protein
LALLGGKSGPRLVAFSSGVEGIGPLLVKWQLRLERQADKSKKRSATRKARSDFIDDVKTMLIITKGRITMGA